MSIDFCKNNPILSVGKSLDRTRSSKPIPSWWRWSPVLSWKAWFDGYGIMGWLKANQRLFCWFIYVYNNFIMVYICLYMFIMIYTGFYNGLYIMVCKYVYHMHVIYNVYWFWYVSMGEKVKKQSGSVSSVQNLDLLDRWNLIPKIAMGGSPAEPSVGVILEVHEHVIQNFKDRWPDPKKVAPKLLNSAVLPCFTMVDLVLIPRSRSKHSAQSTGDTQLCPVRESPQSRLLAFFLNKPDEALWR